MKSGNFPFLGVCVYVTSSFMEFRFSTVVQKLVLLPSPAEPVPPSVHSGDGFPETSAGYRNSSEQRGGPSDGLPVLGTTGREGGRCLDAPRPLLSADGPGSPLGPAPLHADRAATRHPASPFSSTPGAPGWLRGVNTREELHLLLQVGRGLLWLYGPGKTPCLGQA